MCGFVIALSTKSLKSDYIIDMTNEIKHRGPDSTAYIRFNLSNSYFEKSYTLNHDENKKFKCAAGFNRLSIRDISNVADQPMVSQINNSFICFNGEAYNTNELLKELNLKKANLRSSSDTEILLEYFLQYGVEKLAEKIEGMYSICLYDADNKCLYVLRDRFGIKPLYYSFFENTLIVASEIKSILKHPDFKFKVSYDNFDEYLKFRYVTPPNTLIESVYQIMPGEIKIIDSNLNISTKKEYWKNIIVNNNVNTDLNKLLSNSVKSQLVSDVEIGLQLSGGLDSSLITYIAQKLQKDKKLFKTFSINFEDPFLSEKKWSQLVATKTCSENFSKIIDENYFFNNLEKATYHLDNPLMHPNSIGILKLADLSISNGIKVLLSGEGADELFGGYSRFFYIKIINTKLVKFLIKRNKYLRERFYNKLHTYSNEINSQIINASSINKDSTLSKIYLSYSSKRASINRYSIINNIKNTDIHSKHRIYEILTYLQSLLIRQDKMNMAFSVENRVPFLSSKILSSGLNRKNYNISLRYLISSSLYILRHPLTIIELFTKIPIKIISYGVYGLNFTFRKKAGFAFPIGKFMKSNSFIDYVEKNLLDLIDHTPLDRKKILFYWNTFKSSKDDKHSDILWTIFTYLIWLKEFDPNIINK